MIKAKHYRFDMPGSRDPYIDSHLRALNALVRDVSECVQSRLFNKAVDREYMGWDDRAWAGGSDSIKAQLKKAIEADDYIEAIALLAFMWNAQR